MSAATHGSAPRGGAAQIAHRTGADISIVRASAHDLDADFCSPEDVALAAEVISLEPEEQDFEGKRMFYVSMGIPTFWLFERGSDNAPIAAERDLQTGVYRLIGTPLGCLVTDLPFPIDIPLMEPRFR